MKTIEQLKDQHNELLTKLRNEWTQEGADELLQAIRNNEAEQKRLIELARNANNSVK